MGTYRPHQFSIEIGLKKSPIGPYFHAENRLCRVNYDPIRPNPLYRAKIGSIEAQSGPNRPFKAQQSQNRLYRGKIGPIEAKVGRIRPKPPLQSQNRPYRGLYRVKNDPRGYKNTILRVLALDGQKRASPGKKPRGAPRGTVENVKKSTGKLDDFILARQVQGLVFDVFLTGSPGFEAIIGQSRPYKAFIGSKLTLHSLKHGLCL
jgi:hypothetical protein